MKAMISQPMYGKSYDEIFATRDKAASVLREHGCEVVNTLFYEGKETKRRLAKQGVLHHPLYFLAKSLEQMSQCDTVYFCEGWENARGCRIEHEVACAYNLHVVYEIGYNILNTTEGGQNNG